MKQYLLTAGPTPVPERVLLAMAEPVLYHRAPTFTEWLREVQEGLRWIFQTTQPVLLLAGSGTAGMEAAVVNFLSRGDALLVVRGGKFGERWGEIASAYGLEPTFLDVEWGKAVRPEAVEAALVKNPAIKAVYTTANETSTGVRHPVEAIARSCQARPSTLCVVDAITALGVYDLAMDRDGIDVLVTGSQKALMLPPGLAFVAVSEKGWKLSQSATLPRFYLDLARERKSQEKGETAYTPAVSLVMGLREVFRMLRPEGLPAIFERHDRLARATRAAAGALGLELYAPSAPSPAVTAIKVPAGVDGSALVKQLRNRYGITIAGGQGELKGKIFRIAHLGYFGEFDILTAVTGVEMALADLGHPVRRGAGVAAAEEILGGAA